jgi:DNA-binding transcriptional regulator YdaS (Cro superfamily)
MKKHMSLKKYWRTLECEEKHIFAEELGVNYQSCSRMINNPNTIYSPERCLKIEELSGGDVPAESVGPQHNWSYIRAQVGKENEKDEA